MSSRAEAVVRFTDPVCGMTVTPQSPHVLEHEGRPQASAAINSLLGLASVITNALRLSRDRG